MKPEKDKEPAVMLLRLPPSHPGSFLLLPLSAPIASTHCLPPTAMSLFSIQATALPKLSFLDSHKIPDCHPPLIAGVSKLFGKRVTSYF